ncbi:MAG: DUF2652 domain-containing protein [Rhodanobacteraceae bacterium]
MRISVAYLVVVDISGYTRFVTERSLTLAHAEQIITDLINAVLDRACHPMILNKLEGDAALMYREVEDDAVEAGHDVLAQVRSFFPAFHACATKLRADRHNCTCDACANIAALKLKAFVHLGEIAIKQVRQFEELAGEPVILVHRLMKNAVPGNEYVLLTQSAISGARLDQGNLRTHTEAVEGMGVHHLWLIDPLDLPELTIPARSAPAEPPMPIRSDVYRHLPLARPGFWRMITGWLPSRTA